MSIGFLLTASLLLLAMAMYRIIEENTEFYDVDWELEEDRHL